MIKLRHHFFIILKICVYNSEFTRLAEFQFNNYRTYLLFYYSYIIVYQICANLYCDCNKRRRPQINNDKTAL